MNLQILIGHVGKDPEVRTVGNDKKVANFTVATSDGWGDNKKTNWHNVVVWGKTAEVVEKYVAKGSHIAVEGRTDHRSYENKEGVKKYVTEVVCNNLELLSKKESKPQDTSKQSDSIHLPGDGLPF